MVDKSFLGRGFSFPFHTDASGGLSLSAYEENIKQSINLVLGTALGERVYRPTFGSRIHDYLFAPNNDHTRNMVSFYAQECLKKWEPRIEEVEVEAHSISSEPGTIRLEINYQVKATNSHFNLVYPFYLRREEDL